MDKHSISSGRVRRLLMPLVALATASAGVVGVSAMPAHATGTTVGYACGFHVNASLFGAPFATEGCGTQTSQYASANSSAPQASWTYGQQHYVNDADGGKATYGPADFISSPWLPGDVTSNTGATTAYTYGTTSTSAMAKAVGVGPSPFYTATPNSLDHPTSPAGYVQTTCTASSPTSYSGTTTITNGYVDTKLDSNGYPVNTVTLPVPIPVNYRVDYTIDNVGDYGYIIFNERIVNADGSYTVNGSHMYMTGPTAFGDVIIAQVTCGHA